MCKSKAVRTPTDVSVLYLRSIVNPRGDDEHDENVSGGDDDGNHDGDNDCGNYDVSDNSDGLL